MGKLNEPSLDMVGVITLDRVWIVFPLIGPIRVSTVITFTLVALYVIHRFGRPYKRSIYQAVVAVFFTASLYEVVYMVVEPFFYFWRVPVWEISALMGWILLGLQQAREYYKPSNLSISLLTAATIAWVLWILGGFPINTYSQPGINLMAETYNITTKALLPLSYVAGLRRRSSRRLS